MQQAVATAMERRSLSSEIKNHNRKLLELQDEIRNRKVLEEITRGRGEIYASIFHDINGPLMIISGFAELINQSIYDSSRIEGDNLQIVKDRISRVILQVSNCIQISRRYLSFLRDGAAQNTQVGVNQILSDLRQLLKAHCDAQKNSLIVHPLQVDVAGRINGADLIQVLLDLTINAFQCSSEPHKVEIRALVLGQPVEVASFVDGPCDRLINREGFQSAGPQLAISVTDNRPGIPSDMLSRIFEPCFTTKASG
ncbi:MAG: hypothetical protein FJ403_07890 [Verrucomicrobia bacterium]|nr:hypothetical protein [Verrucomicrobiota bacterium]